MSAIITIRHNIPPYTEMILQDDDKKIVRFQASVSVGLALASVENSPHLVSRDRPVRVRMIAMSPRSDLGAIQMLDVKIGTHSQFAQNDGVPCDIFASQIPMEVQMDTLQVGQYLTVHVNNHTDHDFPFVCHFVCQEPDTLGPLPY
jgi:hypothetical protein